MTAFEWDEQFSRLENHFHVPVGADKDKLSIEWFNAMQHWHVDAVDRGVTDVIRNARDRFWPPLGLVIEAIRVRLAGVEKINNKCETCHGSTWIEAWPVIIGGRVYEMNQRCPDCGVPAPPMPKPHPSARPLTKAEYEAWQTDRAYRDTMPDFAKAKKPALSADDRSELRDWINQLRQKLFGGTPEDHYKPGD